MLLGPRIPSLLLRLDTRLLTPAAPARSDGPIQPCQQTFRDGGDKGSSSRSTHAPSTPERSPDRPHEPATSTRPCASNREFAGPRGPVVMDRSGIHLPTEPEPAHRVGAVERWRIELDLPGCPDREIGEQVRPQLDRRWREPVDPGSGHRRAGAGRITRLPSSRPPDTLSAQDSYSTSLDLPATRLRSSDDHDGDE